MKIDNIYKSNAQYSVEKKPTSFIVTQHKMNAICSSLTCPTGKYSPEITINNLRRFLNKENKLDRLLYSEISNYIFSCDESSRGMVVNNIESLLCYTLENRVEIDTQKIVIKIYDHIQLSLYQIENSKAIAAMGIENEKEELKNSIKETEKDHVAILGIFAAIVLAFVGEFAFSTSVLENVNKENFTYTLSGAMLIGVVFFNGLYGLFCFLSKVTNMKTEIKWWHWVIPNLFIIAVGMIAIFLNK